MSSRQDPSKSNDSKNVRSGDQEPRQKSHLQDAHTRRLLKELREMTKNPPPLCSARLMHDDIHKWQATIQGPPGSVYEGGTFKLILDFPRAYPFKPPKVVFETMIYHCNINSHTGAICLDVLNEKWSPAMSVSSLLVSICSLLCDCNPNDALESKIACLYMMNRLEHDRKARMYTQIFGSSPREEHRRSLSDNSLDRQ